MTARSASAAVLGIIERQVIPDLSPQTANRIESDLARHFSEARLSRISWTIAILGAVASGIAIRHNVPNAGFQVVVWWAAGFSILYVTAARATNVARFYYYFAKHLGEEPNIYVLDPARSNLVMGISAVGKRILLFWVGILVAVAMLVPVVSKGAQLPTAVSGWHSWLLMDSLFGQLVVSISALFSIPFGTAVFLMSENMIRKAVESVRHAAIRFIERDVASLFASRNSLDESQWKRVGELRALHKDLATSGSYQSLFASGLSLLVPLSGPAAAALLKLFSDKWKPIMDGFTL
jgi:hypothetical protein